jgi:hypothetical protein
MGQNARDKLKRDKLDFTERKGTDTYKTYSLFSHKRPVTKAVDVRKPDRVLDRPATQII